MKYITLIILACSIAYGEDVWLGLRVGDYDKKGKYEVVYYAGQVADKDIQKLKDGNTPDGFIEVKNVMYIDNDDNTYEMNSDGKYSKEESDTYLVKIRLINQIIVLKDDPRKIYKRKEIKVETEKKELNGTKPDVLKW